MAYVKSLFVGILLLSIVYSSSAQIYFNFTQTTPVAIPNSGDVTSTISISSAQNLNGETFDGVISIRVTIQLTHNHPSELKIELETPVSGTYGNIVLLSGDVEPTCAGKNIDAVFSKFAGVIPADVFEKCDTSATTMVFGQIKATDADEMSPASGTLEGDYILHITDLNGADSLAGNLVQWRLEVSNDLDQDGVDNDADNCPIISNAVQRDEDQDGVGNECQCARENYQLPEGQMKVCYFLDSWGKDNLHWKGLAKTRGEWVSLVTKYRTLGEFHPGDYSHTGTWLDCECNSHTLATPFSP